MLSKEVSRVEQSQDDQPPIPSIATVHVKVQFLCHTMQEAINCGVNGFAVLLLAESLGDKDKLVDGGVMFAYPFDHKKRPVWIIVTSEPPFVASVSPEQDVAETEE